MQIHIQVLLCLVVNKSSGVTSDTFYISRGLVFIIVYCEVRVPPVLWPVPSQDIWTMCCSLLVVIFVCLFLRLIQMLDVDMFSWTVPCILSISVIPLYCLKYIPLLMFVYTRIFIFWPTVLSVLLHFKILMVSLVFCFLFKNKMKRRCALIVNDTNYSPETTELRCKQL